MKIEIDKSYTDLEHPRQVKIHNADLYNEDENADWDDIYVHLTGYCGKYNPEIFAAAPDLYDALEAMVMKYGSKSCDETKNACRAMVKARGDE